MVSKRALFKSLNVDCDFPAKEYQVIIYGQKGTIIYDAMAKPALTTFWYKKTPKLTLPDLITKKQFGESH